MGIIFLKLCVHNLLVVSSIHQLHFLLHRVARYWRVLQQGLGRQLPSSFLSLFTSRYVISAQITRLSCHLRVHNIVHVHNVYVR